MRKKPFLLVAAGVAAGLVVLKSVSAQTPPPAPVLPATTVRTTPNVPPPPTPVGYTPGQYGAARPAGGVAQPTPQPSPPPARGRLTSPVAATADGVRPAAAFDIPPPNLDMQSGAPKAGAAPQLPPPSVSFETPGAVPPVPVNPEPRPLVPVPPASGGTEPSPLPIPTLSRPSATQPVPTPVPAAVAPILPVPVGEAAPVARPAAISTGSLSGKVTQTVSIEAVCPETVVFGGEFRYELIVKNAGTTSVAGVRVEDELPAGTKYLGSEPQAELNADRLSWSVGALDAGAEKRISVRVRPAEEGELRSRATVTYAASVDARTRVTRPRISVAVAAPEVAKSGEEPLFQIKVTNSGTGPAQKMVLQAFLSEGLVHPAGSKLELELASLPAGESKVIPLKVSAGKSGLQWCQVAVSAQGSQDATAKASVNVLEPQLHVTQTGPTKCFVRAEPVYEITLSNPGTAATDPVNLYAVLPEGFEFLQGGEGATYSAANRAVVWKLAGIAPGASKAFTLKLRATVEGEGQLRTIAQAVAEQPVQGVAAGGAVRPAGKILEAKAETAVKAEGVAAVRFDVVDLDDPVEVGKEAVYEIRVTNQGTGACSNIQLVAAMAEGTSYTGSSGPTQVKAQGQHLVFDPIPTLGVKGEAVYRVKVRGSVAGDTRFKVQLTCDQVRTPVVKEESTRFVKQ